MAEHGDGRVVVGVDGMPDSEAATAWALDAARARSAGLHLVHAIATSRGRLGPAEAEEDQRLREAGKRLLERQVGDLTAAAPDVAVTSRLVEAPAYEALLQETAGALLLALGARGTSYLPQLPIGSVPVHLTALAPCPVVVVRAGAGDPAPADARAGAAARARVVVGLDVDPSTDPAFAFAVQEAELRGATLVVVRAVSDGATRGEQPTAAYLAETEQRERQRLAQWLAPWRDKDLEIRPALVRAHPVQALLHESAGAALLVVGSHGGGVAKGILLGSVSQALMRSAQCPLAVVRTRQS